MEATILNWMGDSAVGQAVRDSVWLFPAMETVHFIGLCVLFSALIVMDLRILGFAKEVSFKVLRPLSWVAATAVTINLLSGLTMMSAFPMNYWPNTIFKVKVLFILLGAANAIWFVIYEHKRIAALGPNVEVGLQGKIVAQLSLIFWVGVLITGRLLPYLSTSTNG